MSFDHRSWKIRYNANKFSGSAVERNSSTMRVKADILAPEGTSIRRGRTPPVASIAQDARRTRYACAAADGGRPNCAKLALYAFHVALCAIQEKGQCLARKRRSLSFGFFQRGKQKFPTSEIKFSYVGNENSLRRKFPFPALEIFALGRTDFCPRTYGAQVWVKRSFALGQNFPSLLLTPNGTKKETKL